MKHFLIKYRLANKPADAWHREVAEFIAALDADPVLQGKISYRCMKSRNSADYYHLASAVDDQAIKALQQSAFFPRYAEQTKQAAGGEVNVVGLEVIAETARKA